MIVKQIILKMEIYIDFIVTCDINFFIFICILVCGAGRKTRIVGGTVANIAEFPWMVGMTKQGQFHCGGSLITRLHVLTAAHCLEG